jgi:hypothetical protein
MMGDEKAANEPVAESAAGAWTFARPCVSPERDEGSGAGDVAGSEIGGTSVAVTVRSGISSST